MKKIFNILRSLFKILKMHLKYVQIQKAACLQVFYLQFTSPQFYLYILPVYFVSKSKTYRMA